MDKIKPMHNKTVPANGLPVVTDLTKVDDPSIGDMVLKNNSGTLELQVYDGSHWHAISGGNTTNPQIQDVGVLATGDDPTSATWGTPHAETQIQTAYVQQTFQNAPPVASGNYVGTLSKMLGFDSGNGNRIEYFTADGEHWTRTKLAGGWDAWIHVNPDQTPANPAIWVLDTTTTTTTAITANTPTTLKADVANKFNAVEQEYLGNLNMLSATDLVFTAAQAGDYEFQVRGVVEDSGNAISKMAFSLMDSASTNNLTGSLWTQPAAYAWGGTNEFSINCTGLLRMAANATVTLQAVADATATIKVSSLIVKMTKIA